MLNLFRAIPGQEEVFQIVWRSAVNELLRIPDQSRKWRVVTALISNDAVATLARGYAALQELLLDATMRAIEGGTEAWPLFEAAVTFGSLSEATEVKLLDQILKTLDADDTNVDGSFTALEFISTHKPGLLRQESSTYVTVITKLLALTEISDSTLSLRASRLRSTMEDSDKTSNRDDRIGSPIIHVIRENLETASPQSLA